MHWNPLAACFLPKDFSRAIFWLNRLTEGGGRGVAYKTHQYSTSAFYTKPFFLDFVFLSNKIMRFQNLKLKNTRLVLAMTIKLVWTSVLLQYTWHTLLDTRYSIQENRISGILNIKINLEYIFEVIWVLPLFKNSILILFEAIFGGSNSSSLSCLISCLCEAWSGILLK